MRPRGSPAVDPTVSRTLPPGSPLAPPLLFGSASPSAPTSIWSTTSHDSASLSASNLRVTGYPGAQARLSPPAIPTYASGLAQSASVPPITPARISHTHQRHLSQPPAYSPGVSLHQGPWSSQGSPLSQSQSQQRHALSPSLASFPLEPIGNARAFGKAPSLPYPQTQQQHALFPGVSQKQFFPRVQSFSPQQTDGQPSSSSLHSGFPTQGTWSYSGEGSLTGLGAPLGPFTADLPYSQPRMQQQAQMQRSGAWASS